MEIKLYNMTTDKIRVDKTDYLINELVLDGTLKEECSITSPTLLLDSRTFQTNISLFNYNYVYIVDFDRYYFIGEIVSENTYLWRIGCVEDTLMTYKDRIKNLTAYVLRNENTYDELQQDTIPVKSGYDIEIIDLKSSSIALEFPNQTTSVTPYHLYDFGSFNYAVISTLQNVSSYSNTTVPNIVGFNTYIVHTPSSNALGCGATSGIHVMFYTQFNKLAEYAATDNELTTYIISLVIYPFEIMTDTNQTSPEDIVFGEKTYSGVTGSRLQWNQGCFIPISYFCYNGNGNFLDYDPYTSYSLYLPYYGWVDINAEDLIGNKLLIAYIPNYQTGSAIVEVIKNAYDSESTKYNDQSYIVFSSNCQLGISVSLNTSNALQTENQRNAVAQTTSLNQMTNSLNYQKTTTNSIVDGVSSFVDIASGNIGKGVSNLVSTGVNQYFTDKEYQLAEKSNLINAQIQYSQIYDNGSCTISSGNFGRYSPQRPYLKVVKQRLALDPDSESFRKLQGRVLNQYVPLSNLTGFTTISAVHLDNFEGATLTELNTLDDLLKAGIIL